ncbi:hypothetical protein FPSE_08482 [Fusarium pseudograminearum CS3096]|uniref:Uncharacterized protein n=1 Tax=Fusarium pseudograminearum (strain CS3096) TaxID=1028729 RepID=K3VCK9_FUSPC|nr:hypothetical protein FPSE_08482 [Fusarium pseudograminearum CS3096]EKJ71379.1 hypothetical protein FPSE_08482 [Fusarium pseudograminearum CS3096]
MEILPQPSVVRCLRVLGALFAHCCLEVEVDLREKVSPFSFPPHNIITTHTAPRSTILFVPNNSTIITSNLHHLVVSHSMHRMPRNRANNSAGPSGQSAPVVPPAPKFIDFRDDKSYAEAKAAWHVARAEYNRYQAVYYETAAKRHREWLQSDIEAAAFHKHEAAVCISISLQYCGTNELIAQAQAEIEAKKAAIGVANEPPKND